LSEHSYRYAMLGLTIISVLLIVVGLVT